MIDEKENFINEIVMKMGLDREQSQKLKNMLHMYLYDYSMVKIQNTDIAVTQETRTQEAYKMFFVAKRIQGCTDRTIENYKNCLGMFFREIQKEVENVTTNDIRYFLAMKKERDKASDCHVDNLRRVLSSFFTWCVEEEYIEKNPVSRVKKVKVEKYVKKAFSDIEVEKLRQAAMGDLRTQALLEVLLSTGCRISEVYNINIGDVNGDEIIVKGKGKKERIVYLNAKARISLENYLKSRKDDNKALFVSEQKPHNRLKTNGMEYKIRELGRKAGVEDTHPHRFRRTAATNALNRGMPIDQVSIMLGHSNIQTTTIYATSAQEIVKENHKKYVV